MSDMIERVAQALLRAEFNEVPEDEGFWKKYADTYRAQARAAIEAMREPTGAMVDAGKYYASDTYIRDLPRRDFRPDNARLCWTGMIDEALK